MRRVRASGILIQQGALALIERHRLGQHYYAFPGGGVKKGETLKRAVVRELKEELGLTVTVIQLVAVYKIKDETQYFFLVRNTGGAFGSGHGEEYAQPYNPRNGTYHPVWLPIDEIVTAPVKPVSVATLVAQFASGSWPAQVVYLSDD